MNIAEVVTFDKDGHIERNPLWKRLYLALVILLVALLAFGIGRLTVVGKSEGIRIEYNPAIFSSQFPISTSSQGATALKALDKTENSKLKIDNSTSVVASKNGTKYHFSYCPGAKSIKEENKISFNSAQEAEAAGYTLAGNCKPR